MSELQWYGSTRGSDASVDAYDMVTRARVVTSMHPYLAQAPDTLRAMVESDATVDELVDQSGAMYGMQSADQLSRQLSKMSGPTQRAIWGTLTVGQQMALSQMGYQPAQDDDDSTINGIIGGIAGVAGTALGGISKVVMPVAKPALETLTWVGNWPGHLYRTIRLQDGFSQAVGGAFGILGAIGALALAPATFGASLGTFTALGVAGLGALGAASAASFVSSSITNPGDWWRAFQSSWDGERTFKRGALAEAEAILGDPRLTGLAQDLALVEGFSMLDFAQELVAGRGTDQNSQLAAIEKIASRIGGQGTAEFQAAANAMVNVMSNPDFQRAVTVLQQGKISPGRDLANFAQLDPESGLYRIVSGLADATFTIAVDPTIMLGAAAKWARAQRYGLRVLEGAPSAERFLEVAMKPGVRRYHEVVARAVQDENSAMIRSFAPEFQQEFGKLIEFKQMLRDTGELAENKPFTDAHLREYFIGATNFAPLLRGVGTVRGSNQLILKSWGPMTSAYRKTAAAARAFVNGLQDPRLEAEIIRQLGEAGGAELAEALPPHINGVITENGLMMSAAERIFPELSERMAAAGAKPWQYNQVSLDAYEWGRTLGELPVLGRAVARIGEVITSMTTMAPAGKSVQLAGDTAFRDVTAMAELGRYMGMPSWARRMWADTILSADSPAARVQALHGWLDNALTITGARYSEEGSRLVDQFLERSMQMYGANDQVIVNGRPMHAGLFLNQQANEVVMPGLKALFDATAKGNMAKFLGIADLPVIEPLMTKVWKPFVLLRIGFIPRAAGEEFLNFMLRGGIGSLGQEFGARSIGQANIYDKAVAKRVQNKLAELTADESAALLKGPLARIPAHMRPLVRMMARIGWGDPALHYADRYGNWLRGMLNEGVTSGRVTRRLDRWVAEAEGRSQYALNLAENTRAIFLGSQFSWRRMIAGGVHDDLVEAAEHFYKKHATTILREVSATNAGPLDPGYDRANTVKILMPGSKPGELTPVEMMQVRGSRAMVAQGDGFFNKAIHDNIAANAEDPVVRLVDEVYRRVKPATVSHELVYETQREMEEMGDLAHDILLDFLDVPREDVWRATIAQLAPRDPQLAQLLELITPDSGMPTYDEIVTTVEGWVMRGGALIDQKFIPVQSWHRGIAEDLKRGQRVLQQLDTLDDESRAWTALHLHANGRQGVGIDVEDIGRVSREPLSEAPPPRRRLYRGVSTPSQIEVLPDGTLRLHGQQQDHWTLRDRTTPGIDIWDRDSQGLALSFTSSRDHAIHYADLDPDAQVGMVVELDWDYVEELAGRPTDVLPSGMDWPTDEDRLGADFGLYHMGEKGEVNFNLNGPGEFTEAQAADLAAWEAKLDEAIATGDQAGVLVAERNINDIHESRNRVVKQPYIDIPAGKWKVNEYARERFEKAIGELPERLTNARIRMEEARANLQATEELIGEIGYDLDTLRAGNFDEVDADLRELDEIHAELQEAMSDQMHDGFAGEEQDWIIVIPGRINGSAEDLVIDATDWDRVNDAIDVLTWQRSRLNEVRNYGNRRTYVAKHEADVAALESIDATQTFDDMMGRLVDQTRQKLVAFQDRLQALTSDETAQLVEAALLGNTTAALTVVRELFPDEAMAELAQRFVFNLDTQSGRSAADELAAIVAPERAAQASALRVTNPTRQQSGMDMVVRMWSQRTGLDEDVLVQMIYDREMVKLTDQILSRDVDWDSAESVAEELANTVRAAGLIQSQSMDQGFMSYADQVREEQLALESHLLRRRLGELDPAAYPKEIDLAHRALTARRKVIANQLSVKRNPGVIVGFHSGDNVAASPVDWFDRMTGLDRPNTWGTMPTPDPFFGSLDQAQDEMLSVARSALMNPHLNDDVARSVRLREGMEVEAPSIAKGGTVPLYVVPATASTALGDAFNSFDEVVRLADNPAVLVRNRDVVERMLTFRRTAGNSGDVMIDDVELAKEIATVIRKQTGVDLPLPVQFRRVDRRWLDGRARGNFQPVYNDGDKTRLWYDDSADGGMGPALETVDDETFDRYTEWAKNLLERTNQLRRRGTQQFLRPRMRPGALLEDGTQAPPTPLVHRFDRVNGRFEPVDSDYRVTRKEQFFNAKGDPIPFGHGDWFEQGESTIDEAGSVMWQLVAPAMRDGLDDMRGAAKFLPQEAVTLRMGKVEPTGDVGRVFRSKEADVLRVGGGLPSYAIGETLAAVKTSSWEKFVNFGFDRVIGPSIDAISRNPMSFHFFAQRYRQNKAMRSWLYDPGLQRKMDSIQSMLWERERATAPVISARHNADASRAIAQFTDGEQFAAQWTDGQALAWLRGHTPEMLQRKIEQTLFKSGTARGGLAREARHWAQRLKTLSPTDILNAAPTEMGFEEFIDFVVAAIPNGALRTPETMADAIAQLPDGHILTNMAYDEIEDVHAAMKNVEHVREASAEMAALAAINDMVPFLDSHEFKTQFAEYGKGFLPFWYAEENFMKRWARTLIDQGPAAIRKAQLGYMGLKQAGVVRTDQNGKDWFVYPGSGLLIDTVSRLVPSLGTYAQAAGMMFQTPTDSMLPGVNNRFGTPAFNPLVTIPLDLVTTKFPELQPIERSLVGDYGAGRESLKQLIPAHFINLFEAITGDVETNSRYASAQMAAIAHLDATGQIPDTLDAGQVDEIMRKVANHARIIVLSQALAGFFVPGPPSQLQTSGDSLASSLTGLGVDDPAEMLSTEYVSLVRMLGIEEGTLKFLEMNANADIEDLVNPLAYTQGRTLSSSGAPLPATEQAMQFYDDHRDWMESMPNAGPWLLPQAQGGGRSQYAYDQQTINGLRKRMTPEEYLRSIKFKEGANEYFAMKQEFQDQIAKAGQMGDSEAVDALKAEMDYQLTVFKAAHPVFAQELESGDGRTRRQSVIEEMRVAVLDPSAPDGGHLQPMRQLMASYDNYSLALGQLSQDRTALGKAETENLKLQWEEYGNRMARQHPELAAFWRSVLRPESSLS